MKAELSLKRYKIVATYLLRELDKYTHEQLNKQPSEKEWSIGQLYEHLITGTLNYHIVKIEESLTSEQNKDGKRNVLGKIIFALGSFPSKKIIEEPSEHYTPKFPENKELLKQKFEGLSEKMTELATRIENTPNFGKSEHKLFGYLTPEHWFQLIEMHFRHHISQKQRLDKFLGLEKSASPPPTLPEITNQP